MQLRRILHFTLITLMTAIGMSCNPKKNVDLIVNNGKIYCVDESFSIHQSMAVGKGKILALGTNLEIAKKYSSNNIVDAEGLPVYPGFIDPHCHFLSYGLSLRNVWLAGTKSWEEVVQRLEAHQKDYPTDWVLGRGWNQNEWEVKEFPTNDLLNKAFPNKPVLLTRIDGHAAIANLKAIEMAGFKTDTLVAGGDILRKDGKLTGILIDNAINLIRDIIPPYTKEEKEKALLDAQQNCVTVGLTSVGDAGMDLADILLIEEMQKHGLLQMKVNAMLNPTLENFEHFVKKNVFLSPNLTVRTIKLYADGALGSRGALLLEPYSDAPNTKGLQLETEENLVSICRLAYDNGYQMAIHCIGDAAVRLVLNVYQQFLSEGNDLRWRIEHAQTVHPDDLNRFGKLKVIPSVQTTHATSDMLWAPERLGSRIKHAYRYRELLEQNGWLANGSDFPIEHINPLYGFYAAVSRKNHDGFPPNGFQIENALSREQALRAMTIWAARIAFEENAKGSLEEGKDADFIILSGDLMEVSENVLKSLEVKMTFINGKIVPLNH